MACLLTKNASAARALLPLLPLVPLLALAACSGDASPSGAPAPAGVADAATPETEPSTPAECLRVPEILSRAAAALEAQFRKTGATGGSVAILCGGAIQAQPVGVVRKGGAAVLPTTRFQFASITKTFTAVTAMSLAEEGAVALDAPITTYVPFVPGAYAGSRPFTLADLLSHTAGYAIDIPNASYADDSLEGWFQANGAEPPWSPPGAVFNYSNLGYSLAGLALQRKAARPFGELVEERVFAKTDMTTATMSTEKVQADGDFAYGNSEGRPFLPTDMYFQSGQYGPMGGAWGSAVDLAAFGRALASKDPKVLSAASWSAMTTAKTRTSWGGYSYGYGVILDDGDPRYMGHDGDAVGFSSGLTVVAELGFGVAVVANGEGIDRTTLTMEALEALAGPIAPPPQPPAYSQDDWVGTYVDPIHLGTVVVEKSGGGYVATWGGGQRTLTPYYGDVAGYPDPTYGELTATFWRNDAGAIEWLVTTEGHAKRAD